MMESWEHSKVLLVELLGIYHFLSLSLSRVQGWKALR